MTTFLSKQRKNELQEIADLVGLKTTTSMKKAELESALDKFLDEHSATLSKDPRLEGYYGHRRSPVKKETAVTSDDDIVPKVKARAKKVAKAIEEAVSDSSPDTSRSMAAVRSTPGRALQLAQSVPLPPSPAQIVDAIDRQTTIYKKKAAELYKDAGVTEGAYTVREALSNVVSIELGVLGLEVLGLSYEVLPLRYAFTIPAITLPLLKTSAWPVALPDLFLLLTSHFWQPFLLWSATSLFVPLLFAFFVNLTLPKPKTTHTSRAHTPTPLYSFDPLIFNIAKAVITWLVYSQGLTFSGYAAPAVAKRVIGAIPGGYEGILIGTGIGALVSIYEAVLRK